ncbi:MAG: VOC family protein [Thermoplasmata archaeon]
MVLTSSVVSHLWFLVRDLDKAIRFFGDVLGLRLLEARKGAARFDAGNVTIGLYELEDAEGSPTIVTFRMEKGIRKFHAYLRKQGVKSKFVDMDFIGQVLTVEDPEGHIFWVHQPREE